MFNFIFHEKLRGNYGTSSTTVLKTLGIIFLLFTLCYFLLGFFNYSFGFYINSNLSGDDIENEKPVLITYRHRHKISKIVGYVKHCFLFSLNQMIAGGLSKGFHMYNFSVLYLFPPRKYGSIGLGKIFALIQNITGFLLLFFFITAFLRLNR